MLLQNFDNLIAKSDRYNFIAKCNGQIKGLLKKYRVRMAKQNFKNKSAIKSSKFFVNVSFA